MTTYLSRQIYATLTRGDMPKSSGIAQAIYRMKDVLPKYQLVLADGKWDSDTVNMNAADTEVLQLPNKYDTTKRLAFFLTVDLIVKVTIVSPTHGTSNFLVRGGDNGAEDQGIMSFQGDVTSITLTIAAGAADTFIEYFMFEIPDLTLNASFRGGADATGVA